MVIIRLNAGNDRNGNPRRVFVALRNGVTVDTWDEGYDGPQAIPEQYRDGWQGETFMTTPSEYRELTSPARQEWLRARPVTEGQF